MIRRIGSSQSVLAHLVYYLKGLRAEVDHHADEGEHREVEGDEEHVHDTHP